MNKYENPDTNPDKIIVITDKTDIAFLLYLIADKAANGGEEGKGYNDLIIECRDCPRLNSKTAQLITYLCKSFGWIMGSKELTKKDKQEYVISIWQIKIRKHGSIIDDD